MGAANKIPKTIRRRNRRKPEIRGWFDSGDEKPVAESAKLFICGFLNAVETMLSRRILAEIRQPWATETKPAKQA